MSDKLLNISKSEYGYMVSITGIPHKENANAIGAVCGFSDTELLKTIKSVIDVVFENKEALSQFKNKFELK